MRDIGGLAVSDELFHFGEVCFCLCVLVFEVACGDVGYQDYLLVYVVESYYLVEQHEVNVLEPLLVLRVEVQGGFAVLYVVVGEVPHQTSGERREALQLRAGVLLHEFLDVRRRVRLVRGLGLSGNDVLHCEFAVGAGKLQLGVVAEEGVASPFFLVLDAFKYVNMAADSAELFQYLDRGREVGEYLAADRNNAVSGEFLCLFKSRFQHDNVPFLQNKNSALKRREPLLLRTEYTLHRGTTLICGLEAAHSPDTNISLQLTLATRRRILGRFWTPPLTAPSVVHLICSAFCGILSSDRSLGVHKHFYLHVFGL